MTSIDLDNSKGWTRSNRNSESWRKQINTSKRIALSNWRRSLTNQRGWSGFGYLVWISFNRFGDFYSFTHLLICALQTIKTIATLSRIWYRSPKSTFVIMFKSPFGSYPLPLKESMPTRRSRVVLRERYAKISAPLNSRFDFLAALVLKVRINFTSFLPIF